MLAPTAPILIPGHGLRATGSLYTGSQVIVARFLNTLLFSLLLSVRLEAAPGDLDRSFQSSRGASDTVQNIVEQADGKILIGGDFTAVDEIPRNRIARLNPDGTLDRHFLSGLSGANQQVRTIVLLPDGRILAGGSFHEMNGVPRRGIARLHADGSLDDSFMHGLAGADGVYSIALQMDGKILIAGLFASVNGTPLRGIARLHPDGTLDSSFMDGFTGASSTVRRVALQADGRIVIAGSFTAVNGTPRAQVARLYPDGRVDESFNSVLETGSSQVRAMRLQDDGRILIGGLGIRINGTTRWVVRLNSDGSEDTGFASGASTAEAREIIVEPDGKVIAAGQLPNSYGFITRQNPDGSRDGGFAAYYYGNPSGVGNSPVQCLYRRQDGTLLAGGGFTLQSLTGSSPGTGCNRLIRLRTDGQAEPDFVTFQNGTLGVVTSMLEQSGGRLLACGSISKWNDRNAGPLVRLNLDGTLDASLPNPFPLFGTCVSLMPVGEDDFVAGGKFNSVSGAPRHNVVRFTAGGLVDAEFQPGSLEVATTVSTLARQSDGKLLIATAEIYSGTPPPFLMARINSDGTRDGSFNNALSTLAASVYSIAVLPDGKLLAGGRARSPANTLLLKRLQSDGTLDNSFPAPPIAGSEIRSLAIQPDGKVLVGGDFAWSGDFLKVNLVRLNADGSVDTAYRQGQAAPGGAVQAIALQSDGKAVIGGRFTGISNFQRYYLARLNSDGTLDTGFLNGLRGMEPVGSSSVQTLFVQTDGRIIAAGIFSSVNGTPRRNIARLMGDDPDIGVEYLSGATLVHDAAPAADFGPVPSGESASLTLRIRNTGNRPLSAPQVTLPPANPPHRFSIIAQPGGDDIVPGSTDTFTMGFNPDAPGAGTALLEITSNDPDESPFLLRVTGTKATSLDLWRRQNFGTFANTGSAGDSADPDNDGVVNLVEFATGTPPNVKSPPAWALLAEETEFVFTYTRPTSSQDSVRYSVEWNPSLIGEWQTVEVESITGEHNGIQTVKVTLPDDSAPHGFLRLRVRKLL